MNTVFTIKITRPDESETESMWKVFQAADLVQNRWSHGSTLKDFARRLRDRELTRDERRFILRAWASLVDGVGGFGRLMSSFEEYKGHYQDPDVDYVKAKPELEQTPAIADVIAERQRQVSEKGYTPESDDSYLPGILCLAGAAYAVAASAFPDARRRANRLWPWPNAPKYFEPARKNNPRANLVKAAALIIAEIERLDRAAGGYRREGTK